MREIFRSLRKRVRTCQALRHKRRRVVPKGSQKAVDRRHPRAYTDGGMAVLYSHSLLSSFKHMRIFQHMLIFRHLSTLHPEDTHAFPHAGPQGAYPHQAYALERVTVFFLYALVKV